MDAVTGIVTLQNRQKLQKYARSIIPGPLPPPSGIARTANTPTTMRLFSHLITGLLLTGLVGCSAHAENQNALNAPAADIELIEKTDAQWQAQLTPQEYHVLREAGTERAFTSPLLKEKRAGTFVCAACELPLFDAKTKYKSGTGWPSFWQPITEGHVLDVPDNKYGWSRTENVCARCRSHLGHVFKDGPQPTGLRYCINGVSLKFVPAK